MCWGDNVSACNSASGGCIAPLRMTDTWIRCIGGMASGTEENEGLSPSATLSCTEYWARETRKYNFTIFCITQSFYTVVFRVMAQCVIMGGCLRLWGRWQQVPLTPTQPQAYVTSHHKVTLHDWSHCPLRCPFHWRLTLLSPIGCGGVRYVQ
jgi:hypothetical protein